MNWAITSRTGSITIDQRIPTPVDLVSYDAATVAWAAAVVTAGGTVSDPRKALIDALIVGLKADGVWTKLDRIWILAAENSQSALVDLKANSTATLVNSPAFSADNGYTGNGSSTYINSNFDPTSGTNKYLQDDACLFGWSNTSGTGDGGLVGQGFGVSGSQTRINTCYFDNLCRWDINNSVNTTADATSGAAGLYLMNRTSSSASSLDINGTATFTASITSATIPNKTFQALYAVVGGGYAVAQCACFGMGGSLSSGERTAIYTRLNTYMAAV